LILYAIPAPLGGTAEASLPAPALEQIRQLKDFVVENAKSARAFLSAAGCSPREVQISELNEHTRPAEVTHLLQPLREGRSLGLLSEAGCPAIADPGAKLIEAAHAAGYKVVPLVGPSSIVLALMASGLEGQRFAFCGYLPRDASERKIALQRLERRSRSDKETEIFIETPYRNDAMLAALLENCAPGTRLCVAADLTLPSESIRTRTVGEWKKAPFQIGKRPAVFLLLAQGR